MPQVTVTIMFLVDVTDAQLVKIKAADSVLDQVLRDSEGHGLSRDSRLVLQRRAHHAWGDVVRAVIPGLGTGFIISINKVE